MADQALIRRIMSGDEAALGLLYDRYAPVVYSVSNRILRDTGAAEEVLQDIFYQLWRTAGNFDAGRGSLAGWLLVTARNRSIDRLRRRPAIPDEDVAGGEIASPLNLESAMAREELMARARRAFVELPPPQREAMEMAYFEGLTHTEIAQRTGDPLGTVKTRLRTALQTVKRVLTGRVE
ncbi:MAG TPA: sigma-70 family RNA polymerase sigma factor [Terriglobia bacterium]|nr:sigma-70 family RNA polymerase sigma factor [Terriglobia bacterium]